MNLKKYNTKGKKMFVVIMIAFFLIFPINILPMGNQKINVKAIDLDDGPEDITTNEVFVNDILSPPKYGPSGEYPITAEFSTIKIIMNGILDIEENEPWIDHEDSPDNNGTPHVNFYTSCDDNYIYIAFENNTDGIIAAEIFIDINMNDTWDGPDIDKFLKINYYDSSNDKVKNFDNTEISNSLVHWGDDRTFVEIQIPISIWQDCNSWAFRVRSDDCASISICDPIKNLPLDAINMTVYDSTTSYFDTYLTDVPPGYDVENTDYMGWCADLQHSIKREVPLETFLFSSYDDTGMPNSFKSENWSKINYVINNKQGTWEDVQDVVWYYLAQADYPSSTEARNMITEANASIDFCPSTGQYAAVLGYINETTQRTFFEVTVLGCDDELWNPSWGNNTAPDTPPDHEFLDFTCDYGLFNCPCGVAFKALADIFVIHPGECFYIYETDFENMSDNEDEWINKSLDGQSDTWTISQSKYNSSSNSFHCTKNNSYYGNAFDVLEMKKSIDEINESIDLEDVLNLTLSFWHWAEGDSYMLDGNLQIADYGYVEFYTKVNGTWQWLSLPDDMYISELFYDNEWIKTEIVIEKSTIYKIDNINYTGDQLIQDGIKFRFIWKSDPQFQYEGWYIDDVKIKVCTDEWYDDTSPIWQSQSLEPYHWCIPFNSTESRTFPLKWNAEEGKYLIRVCVQEEEPWNGGICFEKTVQIGNIHDVAVIDIDPPLVVEPGISLTVDGTIKNVGTYDEIDNITVKATLKKNGVGSPIWERTAVVDSLNVSEEKKLYFTWDETIYCDYLLEITALMSSDEVPSNNSMSKWILVATSIFEDDMEQDCCWEHLDLTGGEGHWVICESGYDQYFWCGDLATTKYDNLWNDVAEMDETFNLSDKNNIFLNFSTYCEIAENDIGYVEVSDDGGRHWQIVKQYPGNLFMDWTDVSIDLIDFNDSSNVRIRFRFYSNETITWRGWIINDLTLEANGTMLFEDDFESGSDQWIIERLRAGDWWQRMTKDKDGDSGNIAFWCGDELELPRKYPTNLNNALRLITPIDLSKAFSADILFSTWYDIEIGDLGIVEISDDNGANWDFLGSVDNTSDGWENISYDIDSWLGGDILIQFRFTSDDSLNREGWYVDDLEIVAKLDFDPPVTTISLTGTMGENSWYKSSVQVSLSADDGISGSGVKNTYYTIDGGSQTTYTSSFSVSGQGSHTVQYWSVDNVDNTETMKSETFKIDTVAPSIGITKPDFGIFWRDIKIWPIIEFTLLNWTKPIILRHITITADASDSTSGVDRVEFYIDGELKGVASSSPYSWLWDETVFFNHEIEVKAFDNAGNSNSESKAVWILNLNLLGL